MSLSKLLDIDSHLTARARIADEPSPLRMVAMFLAHTGDSWFWLAGLALFWAFSEPRLRERFAVLMAGILITAVLVMAIKFRVRRRRPEGKWGGVYRRSDPHSFPSGHAARGALLAVLALGLWPPWLGALLLLWAPIMAISRVAMGLHYLSDIVVGMLIGGIMGGVILLAYQSWI